MKDILLITGNPRKAEELSRLLGFEVHGQKLKVPELQEADVREVARAKAQAAYDQLKRPVVVDDSGLYITAWGELPGAFIAWFLDSVGSAGILKMLNGWDNRSARAVTALGYCDENGVQVFAGELDGSIVDGPPRGTKGFGYGDIFIAEGMEQTFAELDPYEKDAVSPRSIAARQLAEYLANE